MGIDSIALVMAVEEKFGIEITDEEGASIETVGQLSDTVLGKITLKPNKDNLTQVLFIRIKKAFEELGNKETITPTTIITDLFDRSTLKLGWEQLEKLLELKLPKVTECTVGQLTDWVVSINSDQLIDVNTISGKYEVERLICSIVEQETGVPIQKIELHYSLTNDLGID